MFNRMAIFSMNADQPAWHGSDKPYGGDSRKSIALNYFTIPEAYAVEQRTIFSNEGNKFKEATQTIYTTNIIKTVMKKPSNIQIGKALKHWRKKEGLTLTDISIDLDISYQRYQAYELGIAATPVLTLKKLSLIYRLKTIEEMVNLEALIII